MEYEYANFYVSMNNPTRDLNALYKLGWTADESINGGGRLIRFMRIKRVQSNL